MRCQRALRVRVERRFSYRQMGDGQGARARDNARPHTHLTSCRALTFQNPYDAAPPAMQVGSAINNARGGKQQQQQPGAGGKQPAAVAAAGAAAAAAAAKAEARVKVSVPRLLLPA